MVDTFLLSARADLVQICEDHCSACPSCIIYLCYYLHFHKKYIDNRIQLFEYDLFENISNWWRPSTHSYYHSVFWWLYKRKQIECSTVRLILVAPSSKRSVWACIDSESIERDVAVVWLLGAFKTTFRPVVFEASSVHECRYHKMLPDFISFQSWDRYIRFIICQGELDLIIKLLACLSLFIGFACLIYSSQVFKAKKCYVVSWFKISVSAHVSPLLCFCRARWSSTHT